MRSWEDSDEEPGRGNQQRADAGSHSWEIPELVDDNSDSADSDGDEDEFFDIDEVSEESAAREYMDTLLSLYMDASLPAQVFCTLCFFASKAGASLGPLVETYAKKPGSPSGHYQRFLNKKAGFTTFKDNLYHLSLPGRQRHTLSRTKHSLPIVPLHEAAAKHMQDRKAELANKLNEALEDQTLPDSYLDNPVVLQPGPPVLPFSLYLDYVPYSHTDSVLGIWLICVLTGVRWCCGVLRKRCLCKCGCRGWCTYFILFQFLRWCCEALGRGCIQ